MPSSSTEPTVSYFDMSKMEQSTSSLFGSDLDDSSWGELNVMLLAREKDEYTLSTASTKGSSALGKMDDSSWGELCLDGSLKEPSFKRSATYGGTTRTRILDDISCCKMTSQSVRRHTQDDDEAINELTNCLKSMYGDFHSTPSSTSTAASTSTSTAKKGKGKSRRKSSCTAPALKRFTTATA